MAGPMHSILYIHNAILSEFKSLEETTKALNYDSKGDAGALLDRFLVVPECPGGPRGERRGFDVPSS